LEENQANFIGRLPLQLESNEGVAGALVNIEQYDLGAVPRTGADRGDREILQARAFPRRSLPSPDHRRAGAA
jgi:hypothetical protein